VLNEFPAMRFIRVRDVKAEREAHVSYQDQVYLKTDPIWYLVINRDFGVPWGPWGWGCGHDVEDVDRDEAEALHLLKPGQHVGLPAGQKKFLNLNQNLQASVKTMDPDLVEKLKKEFGKRIVIEGDSLRWATGSETPGAPVTPPLPAVVLRASPVSKAIDLRVGGKLGDQVKLALAAIDKVHDDGALTPVPLKETRKMNALGFLQPETTAGGIVARMIAVRASGPWPALTAVHEIGHLLDIMAIGAKGDFATVRGDADMANVLAAAEKTAAVQALRRQLAMTSSASMARHTKYLLKSWEIWARAYAQFIAERSGSPVLEEQLKAAKADQLRQWSTEDFAPLAAEIEKMFKQLGWI